MTTILRFGFLLMGFSFTITQGMLIREFLVAFFGTELSIGLILGNWLILEAIGSGVLGRYADRWRSKAPSYALLQALFAVFLPLCLFAVYSSRRIVGAIPGEGVGLIPIFYASFLILIPLAVVDGAMFAFGCRAFSERTEQYAESIGSVYVLEAVGAIIGGLLFTFLFLPLLDTFQIVWLLSALNLLSASLIVAHSRGIDRNIVRLGPATVGLLIVGLGVLLFLRSADVQRWAARQLWPGQDLVYSEDSVYGNVAVVQQESQYTFFADGVPILTAPVPDLVLVEETVHLPLLFVDQPRLGLVLSGGLGGILAELAKYPVERIDYAELDPLLIEAVQAFPTSLTVTELGDPRVNVQTIDSRLLVRQISSSGMDERYDIVIVNAPYPSTLQLNRLYSLEFFRMAERLLTEKGVLVISSPGSLTYMSDELRDLNRMMYRTLRQVFGGVRPIPGDRNLWLASRSAATLGLSLETLVERWEGREVETDVITPFHIGLRLAQARLDWFWAALGDEPDAAEADLVRSQDKYVNRDVRPVGLLYGLSYWSALFSPDAARIFSCTRDLKLVTLGIAIVSLSLIALTVLRFTRQGRRVILPIVIATTGFTGMAADLILIFAFQSLYGFVFHWVTLLITAFMAGLSLGGLLMTRRAAWFGKERPILLRLELLLVLYWVLMPVTLGIAYSRMDQPTVYTALQGLFLLLNAVAGFLVGAQFPVASRLWLVARGAVGGTAGALYASDLVGAFIGAVILSVILIPVLGVLQTCVVAVLLKAGSLLLVATLPAHTFRHTPGMG
jgi:spermidine synthase